MSDQIQRLREVAEAATEGPWAVDGPWWHNDDAAGHDMTEMVTTNSIARIPVAVTVCRGERRDGRDRNLDMRHIATFDPPTVLELLDRLERAEAAVERVRNSVGAVMAVRASGRYDDPTTLGWLDAFVGDITDALDGGER